MTGRRTAEQLKQEGIALESQIADARRRPMNFAWLIGKDGLFLQTDLKKPPEVLWRRARESGGGAKGVRGQITVTGRTIRLACDTDDVPAQLPTLARRFLSERGLVYEIALETPTGAEGAGNSGAAPMSGDDALRQTLMQDFAALADRMDQARHSRNTGAAGKVALLADAFRAQIDADLRKARAILPLLARTIDDALGAGLDDALASPPRLRRLGDLESRIDQLLAQVA